MSITYPRDMPACDLHASPMVPVYQQTFALAGGGNPQAVDVGRMVWACDYRAATTTREDTAEWQAWLHTMRGRLKTFKGIVPRRKWPLAHPRGFAGLTVSGVAWNKLGTLTSVSTARDTIVVNSVANGLTIGIGDWVSLVSGTRQHLHRIVAVDLVSGTRRDVVVEPTIIPGIATGGQTVTFEAPWCDMVLADDPTVSLSECGRFGQFSFRGQQVVI